MGQGAQQRHVSPLPWHAARWRCRAILSGGLSGRPCAASPGASSVLFHLVARRLEGVIRSNGTLSMATMSAGQNSKSMGFWWHKQPADGFYCIYRKRDTENVSSCGLPDCPGIPQTLRRHAEMLTSASVDFIVADSTNIQSVGSGADALQLRPWEVVGEEWLALRKQGIETPKIAIWQNLQDPNGTLWEQYVTGE